MIFRAFRRFGHPGDDRLIELYLADTGANPAGGGSTKAHLTRCPACQARYAGLRRDLDGFVSEANALVDAAFPPERLARQREQILRRIESAQAPVRVLRFPAVGAPAARRARVRGGWVAAAAVLGLACGLAIGRIAPDVRFVDPAPGMAEMTVDAPLAGSETARLPADGTGDLTDEDLLMRLDEALASMPRVAELEALDAFTPSVLEVAVNNSP